MTISFGLAEKRNRCPVIGQWRLVNFHAVQDDFVIPLQPHRVEVVYSGERISNLKVRNIVGAQKVIVRNISRNDDIQKHDRARSVCLLPKHFRPLPRCRNILGIKSRPKKMFTAFGSIRGWSCSDFSGTVQDQQ